eukprot:gene2898-3603_t
MKEVLLLGSGFVAKPAVDYLLKKNDVHITVVSLFQNELDSIVKGHDSSKITPVQSDVMNKLDELEPLIPKSKVVISLLPATFHATIAKLCIKHKVHLVTASYTSPEMKALDSEAKEAGVLLLNELGLDPGIDHMSSMKIIDHAKENGGKVVSFVSWCGALPSMECSDNPFGYKFSWSPRGVLSSTLLPAQFLWDSKLEVIPPNIKFEVMQPITINYQGKDLFFEGVANRDSLPYIEGYQLNKSDVTTMYRGTLRWQGFSVMARALVAIGLFSTEVDARLSQDKLSWRRYLIQLLGCNDNNDDFIYCLTETISEAFQKQKEESSKQAYKFPIIQRDVQADTKYAIDGLKWLGFLDDQELVVNKNTPIDSLCDLLSRKLSYKSDEVDIVVLQHEFVIEYPENRREKEYSQLICFGTKGGSSATSKTVGVPVGIAAELIIDGETKSTGVTGPVTPEFYLPILDRLKKESIEMNETKVSI